MTQPLFRQQAVAAKTNTFLDDTLLVTPTRYHIVAWVAFVIAILLVGILFFGSYTRKDTVLGYITSTEANVRVFPQRTGTVTEVYVTEGQLVKQGQALVKISTARADGAAKSVEEQIMAALEDEARSVQRQIEQQSILIENRKRAIENRIAGAKRQIELLNTQMSLAERRYDLSQKNVVRLTKLLEKKLVAPPELEDAEAELFDQTLRVRQIDQQIALQNETILQQQIDLEQLPIDKATRTAELQAVLDRLRQRLAETKGQASLTIRATTDGRVSALNARPGQSLMPEWPVLSLLPVKAEYYAELYVPTRAVGFIREGAAVNIRYDAYPYQKFGMYQGRVTQITRSVIEPDEINTPVSLREPSYAIKVELLEQTVQAYGENLPLQVGMTLQADVLRDKRRIIEWIFEPLISAAKRV